MSLVIGSIYSEGIILASDSFAFNNNSELPFKHSEFNKFYINQTLNAAFTSVGSRWVFLEFCSWLEEHSTEVLQNATLIPDKWKHFNDYWKTERNKEINNEDASVLRDISDSLLLACYKDKLDKITLINHEGNETETGSFVITGTGSIYVREYLKSSGKRFSSHDTLLEALEILLKSYKSASFDLYTNGVPALLLITDEDIINFSQQCLHTYHKGMEAIYNQLSSHLICYIDKLKEN